ncbi:hypothetical protein [Crocosphaera sp.]|uniref:hypothetical protein n=1 Tax=Crocosphaera sp. TaxID=2729996 RepID=UPI003F228C71|nr:hypothetical protein [Crocosphaera sp.]
MFRIIKACILLSLALSLASCSTDFMEKRQAAEKAKQMRDALEVALEANLKYREVNVACGWWHSDLTSKVIMIPLNKDVIDATVAYKAVLENLTQEQINQLLQKSYQHFLKGTTSTFVMMIINNDKLEFGKNIIYFSNFRENVFLLSESQKPHKLRNYDTNLSTSLNPGLNMGYVSFENFRGTQDGFTDTYTVHFKSFNLTCSNEQRYEQRLAINFDESEVGFVDLIAKVMTKRDIRNKWVAEPYKNVGLKAHDVANLLVFMMKIL